MTVAEYLEPPRGGGAGRGHGPKAAITGLLLQPATSAAILASGAITTDGDTDVLARFASVMDDVDPGFDLVTPCREPCSARGGARDQAPGHHHTRAACSV